MIKLVMRWMFFLFPSRIHQRSPVCLGDTLAKILGLKVGRGSELEPLWEWGCCRQHVRPQYLDNRWLVGYNGVDLFTASTAVEGSLPDQTEEGDERTRVQGHPGGR